MSAPAAILTHGGALRLTPVRLGVRAFPGARAEPGARTAVAHFADDEMRAGGRRVGPVRIELSRKDQRDAATFGVVIVNDGPAPVFVESVCLGFLLRGPGLRNLRFLKNGWQSWSETGTRVLDPAGEPEFPSGPWLRGMHHVIGSPPADRDRWHESATVTVVGSSFGELACLVGVLETGRTFGVVYLREFPEGVRLEVELQVEVPLEPGESRPVDEVRVALGEDPSSLLEAFAELWGRAACARTASPFRVGWCSWYHFFHDVTEDALLRNLAALAEARDEIPVDVVQLDDGYQRAVGDWLETNDKFPRGLAPLADEIKAAGFVPGIWTAPLCVVPESRLYAEHPDWLLRDGDRPFRGTAHPVWTRENWVYALDTTQSAVREHLQDLFRQLVELGFSYLKLDFLHVGAMRAQAQNPRVTRAERLRDGLQAIRAGAGDAAFLLGCGSPLGPAVGVVDAMRIGPDVAPAWEPDATSSIPGLSPTLPSTASALRSIVHRAWMHRRLWQNDPDCLMARRRRTQLTAVEVDALGAAIGVTGGLVTISDDVPDLDATSRQLIRRCADLARAVDGAGESGRTRMHDLFAIDEPELLVTRIGLDTTLCTLNRSDVRRAVPVDLAALRVGDKGHRLDVELEAHESAIHRFDGARRLAVFCDFDGTFSIQDVGSTVAKLYIPERRAGLWDRYESGELTAWDYTYELLDGLDVSEDQLDAFLRTVELDPGSKPLLAWCASRGVPFVILSDGFDRNLEALQVMHDVEFAYRANRLTFSDGVWRIEPGQPNQDCGCGTGTCKGTIISAWRASQPDAFCVHIGNGAVSDLCGARAADLTFARTSEKDTLGPALLERGERFVPFRTLLEVVEVLDSLAPLAASSRNGHSETGARIDAS